MTQLRIFSYIVPRISQIISWSVDTNSYVEPLLKQEPLPKPNQEILRGFDKIQQSFYQPPPYMPPSVPNGRS
jgi:hypothetical protein